jgi:hypothetical protein
VELSVESSVNGKRKVKRNIHLKYFCPYTIDRHYFTTLILTLQGHSVIIYLRSFKKRVAHVHSAAVIANLIALRIAVFKDINIELKGLLGLGTLRET